VSLAPGPALAKSLLDGFTAMVDEVVAELERQGHPGVTATHAFVLQAIDDGAQSASELGRRLNVSRQAAAKSIASLEDLGYLDRHDDPADARRKTLVVTARGHEMITIGAAAFDDLRCRLSEHVGQAKLELFESVLRTLIPENSLTS
jgi:DNA-binding MarR family transcriptional regulator